MQGGADSGVLLQLPHFDYDVVKRMGRKRVRTLAELATMDAEERLDLFVSSGAPGMCRARASATTLLACRQCVFLAPWQCCKPSS